MLDCSLVYQLNTRLCVDDQMLQLHEEEFYHNDLECLDHSSDQGCSIGVCPNARSLLHDAEEYSIVSISAC